MPTIRRYSNNIQGNGWIHLGTYLRGKRSPHSCVYFMNKNCLIDYKKCDCLIPFPQIFRILTVFVRIFTSTTFLWLCYYARRVIKYFILRIEFNDFLFRFHIHMLHPTQVLHNNTCTFFVQIFFRFFSARFRG